MGTGKYARKKQHKGNKVLRLFKTKRKSKDLDEIHEDLKPERRQQLADTEPDADLPGEGKHYCLTCAQHYINMAALTDHMKSKRHKRRMKKLEVEPYTQEEANRAAGMGSYVKPKHVKIETGVASKHVKIDTDSVDQQSDDT